MNRFCRNCFFFIFFKILYALHWTEPRSTKHYSLNWTKIFRVCAHWISYLVTNGVSRLCCQFQTTLDTHYSSTARASIRYANPSAKCVEKHSHHLSINISSLRTWADRVACTSTSNNLLTGGSGSAAPATENGELPDSARVLWRFRIERVAWHRWHFDTNRNIVRNSFEMFSFSWEMANIMSGDATTNTLV